MFIPGSYHTYYAYKVFIGKIHLVIICYWRSKPYLIIVSYISYIIKWKNGHIIWVVGGFCGYGGSVWMMGEWAVGQWIVGVISFHKIYDL